MSHQSGGRKIQSVDVSCSIIEYLRRVNEGTVSEIAEAVDLSPGSAHTHLATLRDYGYVRKSDGTYRLGPELLTLGEHVRNNDELYRAAKDGIEELAETTGESTHLIMEHRGRVLVLYQVFGDDAVGERYHAKKREKSLRHLHCTASGKALLAELPRDRIETIVAEHGMERKTENTITDLDELLEELDRIRDRGFSITDEEQTIGCRAVGASIMRSDGRVAGALSVSGPRSRMRDDRIHGELAERVIRIANVAEVNLNTEQRA
ncbi:IclR family transcriptional regulator [Halopenitus sp. H-Gu1]|uniref:IclR family transcriptional regulator n=1 Tax=Halopenitus sp. H-Gu1 TaxID=3242697 RepID=UPI00359E54EA